MPEMDLDDLMEIDSQRERILMSGNVGCGKTYALLALADYVALRDPKARIFILDADRGIGKVKKAEWPQVKNIAKYHLARKWSDVETFMAEVGDTQTARDWVFIDMIGRFWEMAQQLEVSHVHGITTGRAMLEARKKMVEAQKLNAPGTLAQPDWSIIKRFHNDEFVEVMTHEWDAHIIATTAMNKLDMQRDDALLTEVFAEYGFKPDGEKQNAHRFDTVMFLCTEGTKRYLSIVKDRARPIFKRVNYDESMWESWATKLKNKGYSFADSLQ